MNTRILMFIRLFFLILGMGMQTRIWLTLRGVLTISLFLDKSVLYVIDKSDAIFNATTPTVLFLPFDDIDPGLNELLESFI